MRATSLAVFRGAKALSDTEMQRIAKEMNFSETTFILSDEKREGGYDVRIFTPETELTPQARLNVIFEAGMAFGYCAERTVVVELGSLRPFSDISGRHVVRLDNSTKKRQELAQRLRTLGCEADLSGTDWHTAGNFDSKSDEEKDFGGLFVE